MKLLVLVLVSFSRRLPADARAPPSKSAREWWEIAQLDNTYEHYRGVAAGVLLMYGGRSDSMAVNLVVARLPAVLPHSETKEFPGLDHFGIERTAPGEVARAVSDYFLR